MKKSTRDNIKTFLCLIPMILLIRMIDSIPWWSFVIAVLVFGIIITIKKWTVAAFTIGFLSGLIVWIGANVYFDMTLGGTVFNKIGLVLSVPKLIVILIAGVIGGLLTGLALYTGKSVVYQKEE